MDSILRRAQSGDSEIILLLGLGLAAILALILIMALFSKLRRLSQRIEQLTAGTEGNFEQILTASIEKVEAANGRMDALETSVGAIQAKLPGCYRKMGLIRFDAFEDVGGEQSFSMAMLDQVSNGFVLTGVYSRNDVRVYCKPIREGRSPHTLTKEEERALREAQ